MMNKTNTTKKRADSFALVLLGGAISLNLLVITLMIITLSQGRTQYHERATIVSENLSQVLQQNITGTLRKLDLALLDSADEYSRQLRTGHVDATELNNQLILQHSRLPETVGMRISDEKGIVEYGVGLPAGPKINVTDRDYFIYTRDHSDTGLYITKPFVGRISGDWVVVLARRLNYPDGSYAGVILAPIKLNQFGRTFSTINIGSRGVIALRDDRFGMIVRYPAQYWGQTPFLLSGLRIPVLLSYSYEINYSA